MIDIITKKQLPNNTDIRCFGCHRNYTSHPLGVPIKYYPSILLEHEYERELSRKERMLLETTNVNKVIKREYFDVDSLVCSFNCIYTIIFDHWTPLYTESMSLVPELYFCIFNEYPKQRIEKALNWKLTINYGGQISNEEFEKSLQRYTSIDSNFNIMIPVIRPITIKEIYI